MHGTSTSYSTPRHFHEELEITVTQGNAWDLYSRGDKHTVPPGTLTLTQPGEVHRTHLAGEVSCTFCGLHVAPALLQNVATEVAGREKGLPFFPTPIVTDEYLSTLVLNFHIALERPSCRLEQQSLVLDLLAQLIMRCAEDRPALQPLGWERQPIKLVRDYLEDNYAQNVSLEQLAHIANLSAFHLNRVFCKEVGLPPHAYQTQVRITRAKTLLTSGWSIGQVALETGFASQSHFGWHFKRLVRVTPGQYVKDSKNFIDREV